MDAALPPERLADIEAVLQRYRSDGMEFHALRTRQAGSRAFITVHVLMPGDWTVRVGHEWLERIEADIRAVVPQAHVTTHMETREDPSSHADRALDRD